MSGITYREVFQQAFGPEKRDPYSYQCRLACGPGADPGDPATLASGAACHSQLIAIPTGLGKTAAVVLAWLWNRVLQPDTAARQKWPRRLVYCLPMRSLVEQTAGEVARWLNSLLESSALDLDPRQRETLAWLAKNSPVILMGGEERDNDWDTHPEREAILLGTQDMLLSRALNRGYGMSRPRWPMHFALLNNDALWVMDETQLMGVGVETSAQLDGFRSQPTWEHAAACPTWWMSATLDRARLATVEHAEPPDGWPAIELSAPERASGEVRRRYEARKPIARAEVALSPGTKDGYAKALAAVITTKHVRGTLTLVVVNRVVRAQKIYAALRDKKLKPHIDPARVALIHSRFRPRDRARHAELLFGEGDRIVVATQAVEAGVDVSARLLITELAPWSSLVQRFGRCNRRGEFPNVATGSPDAEVLWIDLQPKDANDDLALPYTADELAKARAVLSDLSDAGSHSLAGRGVAEKPVVRPVLRRRDLVDLFDTTPDLCGQDLDISRYIRDGEDSDVQFFWRVVQGDKPDAKTAPPTREALCRVSIGEASKFLKKNKDRVWRWNPLDEAWEKAERPRPGAVYLADVTVGGYSDEEGWAGDARSKVTPLQINGGDVEAYRKDRLSFNRQWQTLAEHTADVVREMDALAQELRLDADTTALFHTAALWHDVGKVHTEFQAMLRGGDPAREGTLWGKSGNRDGKSARPGLRHELASALAWLLAGPPEAPDRDRVAYLIAAHHGKVRLSIRALPEESGDPHNSERAFARGVWDGERLESVALGELTTPAVPKLDLSFMRMGEGEHGPSWLARAIALRDRLGPFRLAYLETLLRAADMRASGKAAAPFAE